MTTLIMGNGGHFIEVMDIHIRNGKSINDFISFDETLNAEKITKDGITVINNLAAPSVLTDIEAINLGVGEIALRERFVKLIAPTGIPVIGIRSNNILIGTQNDFIHPTVDIMDGVQISSGCEIDSHTLLNRNVNIHHHSKVGSFCHICPGATLLGGVSVGNRTLIGSGSIILPGIKIGDNVKIGAGAVVSKNIADGKTVVSTNLKYL